MAPTSSNHGIGRLVAIAGGIRSLATHHFPRYAMNPLHLFLRPAFLLLLAATTTLANELETLGQDINQRTLHILTWSDYLDPELVVGFEQTYQAKLTFTYFETDEHRDQILTQQGNRGYDLALIDAIRLPLYLKRGWLSRIDPQLVPNLVHLDPRCLSASADSRDYAVPYFWGTQGIVYRGDLVDQPIDGWMQLFKPQEKLRGKIVMIDDSREVMGMAAIALGKSMTSADIRDWEAAAQLVYAQKPYVYNYGYIAIDEHSGLVSGEVLAAQIFNGEALSLQEHNGHIIYVHPIEGSSYWVDYWVLFDNTPQRELAHHFLNYLNEPAHAAANAQSVYFATCNKAAERLLPEDFLQDPIIYPPPEVMERLQPYTLLPPDITRKVNMLYSQITKGP
jgi:spermidine/putrescine transport system substrate-binding protein